MICPECGGTVGTYETRHEEKENEVYRLRKCKVCEYTFFTIEFQTEVNDEFMKVWASISRCHKNVLKAKEARKKMQGV